MNQWVASIPLSSGTSWAGRVSMFGGTLTLTDRELVFRPLMMFGGRRRFQLTQIESVSAVADRPPRLRIVASDGRSLVLLVAASRATPVWSRDTSARDAAVAAINAAINGAVSGRIGPAAGSVT